MEFVRSSGEEESEEERVDEATGEILTVPLPKPKRRFMRAQPPEPLQPFAAALRAFPEFLPSEQFWEWLEGARRQGLDVHGSAIAIADWCRSRRKQCTVRRVKTWIAKDLEKWQESHTQRVGPGPAPSRTLSRYEHLIQR